MTAILLGLLALLLIALAVAYARLGSRYNIKK